MHSMSRGLDTFITHNHSALTVDFEEYLGELLAEHETLAERGHEMADMIARTVHDLRGPLTNVNLRLYLLERASQPEQQARYIGDIRQSVTELSSMMEELLVRVRQESEGWTIIS